MTTSGGIPVNVEIAYPDQDMAQRLYKLETQVAALQRIIKEHLLCSRQAYLQQVGFLEQSLEMNPTTAELRERSR